MMDEAQIRHDLRAYLTRPGALVLDERGAGCCRTDLLVVGQTLHAFEIKSARDSLRRLPAQAAEFSRIFDQVTLVAAPKHSQREVLAQAVPRRAPGHAGPVQLLQFQCGRPHGPAREARRAPRPFAAARRVARTARDKYVAEAASLFDSARGFLTTARDAFFALARRVDAAEARKRESPAVERWDNHSSQTASEKAGVTLLEPTVKSLTTDLRTLGETLRKYGAALRRRSARGELDAADRLRRSLFGLDPPFHRCAWCSKAEERHFPHYALDAEGYACERKEGRRFCCTSCFFDAKDIEDPAPKPLPPEPAAPEPAYAEVSVRALPARRLALPAHVPTDEPLGPGGSDE